MVFQLLLGFIGMGHVFGGSAHISGAVYGNPQPTTSHVSGAIYLKGNSPTAKTHVSGSQMVLPARVPIAVQSKMRGKTRNIGITLVTSEKSISAQVGKKLIKKPNQAREMSKLLDRQALETR